MRLLDTRTKQLTTFYGKDIPAYAILSHMWGSEEDEVLFRHIAGSYVDKLEGKMRKGYAKIKGACKQAVEDGLAYIWIDTCCIDKASSAELSEAINSMYEWYRRSKVCYVYLEDVRSGGDEQAESDKDATFPIVTFERSRWFSRGWTLQELIAPKHVVFFSKGWVDIGTKTGLRDTISAVTRIRVEMLTAYDPEKASVAEKMSWAAFRTTTRVEDIAYCMMGLLGVNMPLLYGEGNKAFRRLQEEFMKDSDDDSLFAWKSHLDSYDHHAEDLNNFRGMLAASPWEFRDGMDIVQSNEGAYSPYSMTNQGLKIKLPLLPIDPNDLKRHIISTDSENIFKTILKCTVRERTPSRWIVIYLKKIEEGRYQRIFPHWLNKAETPPNGTKLTSLLVPQNKVNTKFDDRSIFLSRDAIEVEILPTTSPFTLYGGSLVKGNKFNFPHENTELIPFENRGKCFGLAVGMAIGSNGDPIPWLDFIDVIDQGCQSYYTDSYKESGSRAHLRERHLDRLSERIPGEDWWVIASVKRKYNSYNGFEFYTVIDIQREPIRAKGWYFPPAILASHTFFGKFPGYHRNAHPDFKKEGHNWSVTFNPDLKFKRVLDVSLVHTLRHESPQNNHCSPFRRNPVYCIRLSRDGKYVATSCAILQVDDIETGAKICICFSPDSNFVATGDEDGSIKLWDIHTQCIHKIFGGSNTVTGFLCFSPNGHLIVSGSSDSVQIWNIADGTSRILTIKSGTILKSIAISPNGSLLATGGSSSIIQIWDMLTTRLLHQIRHNSLEVHIVFTPDGKGLVSGSDRTLMYWDVPAGLAPTIIEKNWDTTVTVALKGHEDYFISQLAVSDDERWVISESRSGPLGRDLNSVLFWDLKNMAAQFLLETPQAQGPSLSTSPAGNIFATINGSHGIVQVWRYEYTEPQDNFDQLLKPRPM